MKVRELMSKPVIRIHPEESAAVAARTLARYNIGILPVCGSDGRLCGLITDRDLVTRCVASGRSPAVTPVREIMTTQIQCATLDMDAAAAAGLMKIDIHGDVRQYDMSHGVCDKAEQPVSEIFQKSREDLRLYPVLPFHIQDSHL